MRKVKIQARTGARKKPKEHSDMPNRAHVQTLFEGDTVDKIGNYGQICVRFNIVTKDKQHLLNVIDFINKTLKVFSAEGENLVLAEFKERDIF